ncbi:rabenosyn-5 [Culex quinquefasciatus]|uniref:Rabenosyn-5 n=1 Tax=Culex quinquefasciatus TaxID=7176 RepID=B0W9K8_CULQU|nr:rabenosyn-5 [Culex quinquefasciatus]|eukprot:XP_001845392.1 rabenosyn-5 [Culex quinquefasciatus]
MSNPFDDPDEGSSGMLLLRDDAEILEGFLCPICKADLKTPERLTAHVEQQHSEEQDLLKSLREMFSFAKKKILNLDETASELARNLDSSLGQGGGGGVKVENPILAAGQVVGTDCDHLSYFKAVRNPRLERYATETNKLIIRLDKLLDGLPSDPDARKRHEQSKVPWIDGKLVKLCPSCAKGFGLTRRQHHCRVCGSVMCDGCSFHLSFDEARSIVQPVSPGQEVAPRPTPAPEEMSSKDRDSSGFRVCEHCLHLLMNRKEMQDSRSDRPPVTKLYEKLLQEKREITPDIPMYEKIIGSLYEGDAIYRLSDASALREKIGRAAERIDNISKAILALPFPQGSREESLKKSIRLSCIAYIKEQMLSTPPLPAEDEIKKIQARKKQETARRIERERRLALEAYERYELQSESYATNGSSSSSTASTAEMTNGRFYPAPATGTDQWSGFQTATVNVSASADPLIDQINIVKGYIRQAREAMRFEEVETLERNLSELTQEFYERQRRNAQEGGGPVRN